MGKVKDEGKEEMKRGGKRKKGKDIAFLTKW